MALEVGSRLGHYHVTALIGEGGTGQVYRATDTQLGRDVALKILPDAFAADPDRLARFQREAQVLASLNHPNIAQIYGSEEDKTDGTRALVLELVEGPTLADRIAKGPIPLDEALPIAKQIAEALEAAHEAGVIHRDLKPANIKVREDGTVKVLDFGLAKALDTAPAGDPDRSPTLTAAASQMGVILGTAAYMSPEQARGRTADRRSDLWSLGVVLFEMLTGRPLFLGEDPSTTLSNVQQRDPDWNLLPADLPAGVGRFLKRCLVRDPKARLQGAGDLCLALDGAFEVSAPEDGSDHGSLVTVGRTAAVFLLGSLVALAAVWWLGWVPSIQRERFFRDAFADYTSGRWASAIQGFDDYISRFPDSDLADDAQFYIGQTYYADGQYRQATEAFEQVELSYADGDRVAEALYKRGVALERLGEPEQARRAYELVVQDYQANNVAADLAERALDRTSQGQRPR